MAYVPSPSDRVRVVIEGPVNTFDPATGQMKVGNAASGSVNFLLTDKIVKELEKIPDPEPRWQRNDWVLADDGTVYRRTGRETWATPGGDEVFHDKPRRPLVLLVRDGERQ